MKKNKIFLPVALLGLIFGGLVACQNGGNNGSSDKTPTTSSPAAKEKITITAADNKTTLEVEQTVQLTANPSDVAWSSSNEKVATVDQTGKVTAVAPGDAAIIAKKDGYQDGRLGIKVTRAAALAKLHFEDAEHYSADGWWGTGDDGYMPISERTEGNASDNKCLAHLDEGDKETLTFNVSAAIKAELVIMMASSNGVEDMGNVMGVKLNDAAISMTGKIFEATDSNNDFAEFSLGEQNLKAGDNVLELSFLASAPYIDDLAFYTKQQATITSKPAAAKEQIQFAATSLAAYIDTETQIEVSKPTSLEGITFISSKEDVATVSADGKVTGHKLGTATITAKKDGWWAARLEVVVDKAGVEGEIRVQAESAAEIPEGFHAYTDRTSGIQNGHYGGAYITGYDVNSACSLSYTFESPKDQTMTLIIAGASHYQMAEDFVFGTDCTIKLNGNVVTPAGEAKIVSNQTMGAPTVEVTIGDVQVKAGQNTFVLEFVERAPALDAFRFIPKN